MSLKVYLLKQLIKWRSRYFLWRVKRNVGSYLAPLKVNGKSSVTTKTHFGKNVNFNGINIFGRGAVFIGDNFHSGTECQIITQIHNYEGEETPTIVATSYKM